MKKKIRLFVAINLPEALKDRIEKQLEKIRHSFANDIRFLDRSNWHITITFLGYQEDAALALIVKSMKIAARNFSPPEIEFTDISYGPKDGPKRMIWLNGSEKTASQLAEIKNNLENALIDNSVRFKQEHRKMRVHVTLARFQPTRDLPEIDAYFRAAHYIAENLCLMESHLSRSGANYEVLQRINFKR